MFIDILTFLGHDYRVASLIILYFVVPGISIPKICPCLKWTYGHSGNDYGVAK